MDSKHVSDSVTDEQEQPREGLPLRREAPKSVWGYKRLWVLILLLTFIGGTGSLVPAGKIPLFARLVQAMGFSEEEAGQMPLLRALLKWHQKYKAGELRPLSDEEIAANSRASAQRNLALSEYAAEQNKNNAQSLLVSMRKLNAAQRSRGEKVDSLRGAAKRERGSETEDNGVALGKLKDFMTPGESNQPAGMLFGQEAGLLVRDETDGFNSSLALSKLKNTQIAGSTSATWLGSAMERAFLGDANLGQITREVSTLSHSANLGEIKTIGKNRPQRDLSYVWLMGKTTYRTSNIMLKKTLAAAGWQGEDMPKKVFDSSLSGMGVGINPEDVNMDADFMRARLAKKDSCQLKLLAGSEQKTKAYEDIKRSVKQVTAVFPATCADLLVQGVEQSFRSGLQTIANKCREINNSFSSLRNDCDVAFTAGTCPDLSNSYVSHFRTFKAECDKAYKKCLSETDENGTPNTAAVCAARRSEQQGKDVCGEGSVCDKDYVTDDVRYRVTGFHGNETEAFDYSSSAKQQESGANETDYIASQHVQNIIDTLQGLSKTKTKKDPLKK